MSLNSVTLVPKIILQFIECGMPLTIRHHYFINLEERKREHVVTMMQITQLKQQNKQLWPSLCVQKQRQPHHDCGLAATIKWPLLQDVFWLQRQENVTKYVLESKNCDSIYLMGIREFINKRLPGVFPRWRNNGNTDRLFLLSLQNHCRWWLKPQN